MVIFSAIATNDIFQTYHNCFRRLISKKKNIFGRNTVIKCD